jgi:hypothetical protein
MIDDDKLPSGAPEDRYGEGLLYDLGKFLTSLSLLAIGGVLTVADTADRADIKPFGIIMVTIVLSTAAVLACSTASSIAYGRYTGKPITKHLANYVLGTVALLGMGLGMFFFMWIDKLS